MGSNSASEVEPPTRWVGHHDLGVDDAAGGQLPLDGVDELGEVAGQRALVAAAQFHLVAVAEHDGAEPVPFGFEAPGPSGSSGIGLASIGATGGITGRSMPPVSSTCQC
jgi:hypothetical protein